LQIVADAAINTGTVGGQACGASGLPLPGTRTSDAVIGSLTPRRWAAVTGMRSELESGSGSGVIANSFTSPEPSVMRISSVFLLVVMLAAKLAGTGVPPTMRPRDAPLPWPLANARSRPEVAPLAAAVNWFSAMSITQAPLPIGRPAKVTA